MEKKEISELNEKMKWLQTNNPEVPGLVYKLAPLDENMPQCATDVLVVYKKGRFYNEQVKRVKKLRGQQIKRVAG
jgi:hypothetical protein